MRARARHAGDGTGRGVVVASEAIKAPLAPLGILVVLRARGLSESSASAILAGAVAPVGAHEQRRGTQRLKPFW